MDLPSTLENASRVVLGPVLYPLDPDQRIFWPYLLGSLGLALLTLLVTRRLSWRTFRGLFSPRVWLHRSTLLDLQLVFVKPIIRLLFVTPWIFSAAALALWMVGKLDAWRGVPGPTQLATWQVSALYTFVLFVCWDGSRYVIHRLAHVVPFLWELHKVHHSAEVMTPLTIYRSHPVESLLFQVRGAFVTGVVTGIFFHLFRGSASAYEFLGVNAIGFVLNSLSGNLRHSHIWLRYPRWLEHVFISPAQHQIHHSTTLERCHSNMGSWLAVWDWLFGTLRFSDEGRPLRFGLPRRELNHSPHHLISALVDPVVASGRRLVPSRKAPPSLSPSAEG